MSKVRELIVMMCEGKVEKFIKYLEGTLIPDLKDSGSEFTAKDFETGIVFLKGGKKAGRYKSGKDFADYLENTLIPDLKDSGKEFTAEVFATLVSYLK